MSSMYVALWNSSVWLAATSKKQYLREAERLNSKTNIMDICIYVGNVVANRDMPLDLSVKAATGLVEIYWFNVQSLSKMLRLTENSRMSYKRKTVELTVHVESKRLKDNLDILNWDNFKEFDFDNMDKWAALTDEQIIDCLQMGKTNTVKNIEDITIREDPPSKTYDGKELGDDDDFGTATSHEMLQLFFPSDETSMKRLPLTVAQLDRTETNFLQDITMDKMSIENNRNDIERLDDVELPPVTVDPNTIPLVGDEIECATSVSNKEAWPSNGTILKIPIDEKKNTTHTRKMITDRSTKIRHERYAAWIQNYGSTMRKTAREDLTMINDKINLEKMFSSPLRFSTLNFYFVRNAKIKRSKVVMDFPSAQSELVNKLKRKSNVRNIPPAERHQTMEPMDIQEPYPSDVQGDKLIGATGTDNAEEHGCYVSGTELLDLLQSLWKIIPDELPFDMVKSQITNRLTAASVFSKLLEFSAKNFIRIVKGENGSPQSLKKGSNWK